MRNRQARRVGEEPDWEKRCVLEAAKYQVGGKIVAETLGNLTA